MISDCFFTYLLLQYLDVSGIFIYVSHLAVLSSHYGNIYNLFVDDT